MDTAIVYAIQKIVGISSVFDAIGIFCASVLIWVMVVLIGIFWIIKRRQRLVATVTAFVAALFAWLVNQGIGEMFFRPRPFAALADIHMLINKSALDKSFPSDHAAAAFALAGAIMLVDRCWGWVFIAIASLVAIGRVFVGVHYPSDVLGGAFVGLVCAYIVHRLVHKLLHTKHHAAR